MIHTRRRGGRQTFGTGGGRHGSAPQGKWCVTRNNGCNTCWMTPPFLKGNSVGVSSSEMLGGGGGGGGGKKVRPPVEASAAPPYKGIPVVEVVGGVPPRASRTIPPSIVHIVGPCICKGGEHVRVECLFRRVWVVGWVERVVEILTQAELRGERVQ